MKLAGSSKTPLLQPNSMTQTRRRFLVTPVRKTSVGRLLEADVQPDFVAQPRQLPFSISEATARNVCYSGTSAQSEENQVSTSTTTQQNVFTVQQIQPQAIFAGTHIDKFEGCTFNINVFRGDQSKIARLNEN